MQLRGVFTISCFKWKNPGEGFIQGRVFPTATPVLQEFQEQTVQATCNIKGEACRHYPACYSQSPLYKL